MNTAKNILITPGGLGIFNTTISQMDFKWYESGIGTGIAYPHAADLRATIYNWYSGLEPVLLFGGVGTVNGQQCFVGPYLDYTDVFTGISSFPVIQIYPISGKIVTQNFVITGSLYDSTNSQGLIGSVLASTGNGVIWVAPTTSSGGGGIIAGSFSTNQVLYGVGTGAGGSNNLWFTGYNLGIGTTNPTQNLDVDGTVIFRNSVFDSNSLPGFANSVLISTGVGISWTSRLDLGQPSSGGFTSGLLTISSVMAIPDAVNNINQLLALIAPAQATLLTGNNLGNVAAGLTVKLPNYTNIGISTSWYAGGATSGSTVSGYITNGVYNVFNTTNLAAGGFRAGFASEIPTYGQLYHKIYNYTYSGAYFKDSIDMTVYYVPTYTSGTLSLTAFGIYNAIWNIADATITYTQTNEGWEAHTLYHTLAGESNRAAYYFDTYSQSNPNPSFSSLPTATVVGLGTVKYLSGISYFTFGSQFLMNWTGASGIFNRAYNATNVGLVTQLGMNNQGFNPSLVPNYTDTFQVTNGIVTLNAANQATMNKWLNVSLYKASGLSTNLPASISSAICTYGTVSTQTSDQFFDEAQRLVLNTGIGWTSTLLLTNGNAQVRNGTLQYPNSSDYPSVSFSGSQQYQRWIYKTDASLGTITLTGLNYTNISPYGTGSINVLIYLDVDQIYFDLGILFGTSGKNGLTPSTAYGGQNSGSSGTTVDYNLGTYNTVNDNNRFRLIIIFNNNTYSITNLTSG